MLKILEKNNWVVYVILIVIAFALFLWSTSRQRALQKLVNEQRENYESRLEAMQDTHETQLRERDEAIEEYISEVQQIEERYEREMRELEEHSRARVEDILEKANDDPDYIEELFRNTFGI